MGKSELTPTIITTIINHHLSLKKEIDFTTNNKKHAIYIILGGVISITTTAHNLNQQGLIMALAPLQRLINETVELVIYIEDLPDDSRQLNAWFKGEIIERNEKRSDVYKRIELEAFTEKQLKEKEKLSKMLNNYLSKFMHPSINQLRMTMAEIGHDFDYLNTRMPKPAYSANEFAHFFLIPCLHAILLPMKTFRISENRYNIFREYIKILD